MAYKGSQKEKDDKAASQRRRYTERKLNNKCMRCGIVLPEGHKFSVCTPCPDRLGYFKKLYESQRDNLICTDCKRKLIGIEWLRCRECTIKRKEYHDKKMIRYKKEGKCLSCGMLLELCERQGYSRCVSCQDRIVENRFLKRNGW